MKPQLLQALYATAVVTPFMIVVPTPGEAGALKTCKFAPGNPLCEAYTKDGATEYFYGS